MNLYVQNSQRITEIINNIVSDFGEPHWFAPCSHFLNIFLEPKILLLLFFIFFVKGKNITQLNKLEVGNQLL